MTDIAVDEWDHFLFDDLQHHLGRVNAQPTLKNTRALKQRLEEAEPWLLRLTSVPGPSQAGKEYLNTNPIVNSQGDGVKIIGEVLQAAQQVSQILEIDEHLAAIVLVQAIQQRARYPQRSVIEVAIYTFHEWQGKMLDFLAELLQLTVASFDELEETYMELREAVLSLLSIKVEGGAVADQILSQLDAISARMQKLRTTRVEISDDSLMFLLQALRGEQNKLAGILGAIAQGGCLGRGQVLKVIRWLKKATQPDSVWHVVYAGLSIALQPLDAYAESDPQREVADSWLQDVKFLRLATSLTVHETWENANLKAAVRLVWCLFLHHDMVHFGFTPADVETALSSSITDNALDVLRHIISDTRRDRGLEQDDRGRDLFDGIALASHPSNDEYLYQRIRDVVDSLTARPNFARALRNKEEDAAGRRLQGNKPYQEFLGLVEATYSCLPPDSALGIWTDSALIPVVFDLRGPPTSAVWSMLAAISVGSGCAAKCYERIKESRVAWSGMWKYYDHFIEIMPHLHEPVKKNRQTDPNPMTQSDLGLGVGWTRLLAVIVRHSTLVRSALLQVKPHPVQRLFAFINCENVPVELKALALDAIGAFLEEPEAHSRVLEYYEAYTFADPTIDTRITRNPAPIGWVRRAESDEFDIYTYPITQAYVRFLTALLPTKSARACNTLRRGVHHILDRILLVPDERRYKHEAEQVEMFDAVFGFIEKALKHLDVGSLQHSPSLTATAKALYDNPGFTLLMRILCEAPIFTVLASFVDHQQGTSAIARSALLRVLRIYHRVLDIQLIFADVLVVTLLDSRSGTSFRQPLGMQTFDHYLLHHLSNVQAIATLVGDADPAVSFVSVKIIQALAQSAVFSRSDVFRGEYSTSVNRLAGILDASSDSIRIAQGFCSRLDADGEAMSEEGMKRVARAVLNGGDEVASLPIVKRSTILDILLSGTTLDSPNFAHFLLGFDFRSADFGLQDPADGNSRLSCLHVVLRQLDGFMTELHPVLAAKSARLVHQLFSHPITGRATMDSAGTDFIQSQLSHLPLLPVASQDGHGGVAFMRGVQVGTTSEVLLAFIELYRWILSACAMDTYASIGSGEASALVAEQLFSDWAQEDEIRLPLLVDLLSLVDVVWEEDAIEERPLETFVNFDFDQFKSEVDWWDLEGLEAALRAAGPAQAVPEMEYIVARLGQRNRETDLSVAKGELLGSWSSVLKVGLAMLFKHVSDDRQEAVLFELLDAMLLRLKGGVSTGVLEILCESTLITMTSLVEILSTFEDNLPLDRLAIILEHIVDTVSRPGTTESARGNLYGAISQYLHLLSTSIEIPDDVTALTAGMLPSNIQRVTVGILEAKRDRFFATLCRDATDDQDVWKTECFSLLSGLVAMCQNERDRQILAPLVKAGYLPLFVRNIKDDELLLKECLMRDPENLHAYWVFEGKMAFLLALASSRRGAEQLLDAGIFEILASCALMNVDPIQAEVLADPSATEVVLRQHRVLLYVLQLVARVLSSLQGAQRSGAGNALAFLHAHREAILLLLRENSSAITITGMEELRLLVSIASMVASKVSKDDMESPSSFGGFHASVLAIAARFFERSWTESLVNLGERADAEPEVLNLNHALLVYLCTTTAGLANGQSAPVLLDHAQRHASSKYVSPRPQLSSVVELISEYALRAGDIAKDYEIVLERLEAGMSSITAVEARAMESGVLDVTEISTEEACAKLSQQSQQLYIMIESLLLLAWRHLLAYANQAVTGGTPVRPGDLASSLSFSSQVSQSGVGSLRGLATIAATLRGTLDGLEDAEESILPELRKQGEQGGMYLRMLVRRLQELITRLTDETG